MTISSRAALSRRVVRHAPAPAVLVVGLLLLSQACDDSSPTGSSAELVEMQVSAFVAGTPVNTLVVEVSAADFATLVFNLPVVDGVATGTIRIPPGLARTIHATAFDDQGMVTHEGQATIDVRPGVNPPVNIPLAPRSGQVPVTITFGQYAVVVTPGEATIDSAISPELQLDVAVTTSGGTLPNPAVSWATTNPALATVSTAGLVTGHLDGVVNVVAVYEGVAGLSLIRLSGFGGSAPPPPSCAWPWTPTNVNPCDPAIPAPTAALSLAEAGVYVYDTSAGMLTLQGVALPAPASTLITQLEGVTARVVSVTGFSLDGMATLRVSGEYPLILLINGDAVVDGTVDVSADASAPGPGGSIEFVCGASAGGVGQPSTNASGGGGGGGYGFRGGSGGNGNINGVPGGIGGFAGGNDQIEPLKGGCGGGASGSIAGASGAAPGGGGGAVQIAARGSLIVSGAVRAAGGGGGTGSAAGVGGGGGGAGGGILLESNAVTIKSSASLCANGGSGGEGRDTTSNPAGVGSLGTCDADAPATTPDLLPNGGNGGVGATANFDPTTGHGRSGGVDAGGGGGGGGYGRIRVRGVTTRVIETGAVVTPEPAP